MPQGRGKQLLLNISLDEALMSSLWKDEFPLPLVAGKNRKLVLYLNIYFFFFLISVFEVSLKMLSLKSLYFYRDYNDSF